MNLIDDDRGCRQRDAWRTVTAAFEQYEADPISVMSPPGLTDRAGLTASLDGPMLRLDYRIKRSMPSSESILFHQNAWNWEARHDDGTVDRPKDSEDAAYDHGIWSLLQPQGLLRGAHRELLEEGVDRQRLRLIPRETTEHQHSDGTPTRTREALPSWITICPGLYVPEASHYDAVLDRLHCVVVSLSAVGDLRGSRVLRAWKLRDVSFDGPPPRPLVPDNSSS